MGAFQALVTIVGLIGIVALLILLFCRYLGGWTRTQAWLTSTREEKLVLTRSGVGHYNPNGYMIPSDSELNLSGGGSFRRFDKADQDYQLLRQGSHSSTNRGSQSSQPGNIPPQPLRPAPIPPSIGQVQQQSTDSVFTAPASPAPFPPTPKIPPPPATHSSSARSSGGGGSDSSQPPPPPPPGTSSTQAAAPFNFSSTNPFLPLLQASSNFFSQTISNIGNGNVSGIFSNSDDAFSPGVGTASTTESRTTFDSTGGTDGSYRPSQSLSHSYEDSAPFGSLSSTSTLPSTSGLSMGEIIFSAPPVYPLKDIYQQTSLAYEHHTTESQPKLSSGSSSSTYYTPPPQVPPPADPFSTSSYAEGVAFSSPSSVVTVAERQVPDVPSATEKSSAVRDEEMGSGAALYHPQHSEDSAEKKELVGKPADDTLMSFPFFGRTPFGREAASNPPAHHAISTESKVFESRGSKVNDLVHKGKDVFDPLRRHSVAVCNAEEARGKTDPLTHHPIHNQLAKLKQIAAEGTACTSPTTTTTTNVPGSANTSHTQPMTFFSGRFEAERERGQRQYLYGAGEDSYPSTAAVSAALHQENEEELTNRKMLETMREEIRLENEWMEDATKSLMDDRFSEALTVSSPPPPSPARRPFEEKAIPLSSHHNFMGKDISGGGPGGLDSKRRSSLSISNIGVSSSNSPQLPMGMPTRKFSLASYSPPKSLFSFEPRSSEPLGVLSENSGRFTGPSTSSQPAASSFSYRNSNLLNQKSMNANKSSSLADGGGSFPTAAASSATNSSPTPPSVPASTCSPMASSSGINQVVAGPASHSSAYRVRSFSLRQSSTDSIGSDISDLGSPEGAALPSLQRAMSCDSVCSDTSVVLGDLDPPHLTGHLCVGLEYDW